MSNTLSDLILSLMPEDGSSFGNGAMLAILQEKIPDLSKDDYEAARDALEDEGILAKGKECGGLIYRAELTLEIQDEPAPKPKAKPRNKTTRKSGDPAKVLSYRHGDTRVNYPEEGMVHAESGAGSSLSLQMKFRTSLLITLTSDSGINPSLGT